MAAILVGIDANELNNVFACRHFIMPKIGKIGGFLPWAALNTLLNTLLSLQ